MKSEFVEFLFKRISVKLDEVGETAEEYSKVEDLESYIDALKDIFTEALKP